MRRLASAILLLLGLLAVPAPAGAAEPTGRFLVVFEKTRVARSASLLDGVLDRTGVHRAGRGVPGLGIATVDGPAAAIARLRGDPAVESVAAEWRRDLRRTPNDPALTQAQPDAPSGTPVQWWLLRENFPAAWDISTGTNAVVGVIDTGLDGGHPQLAGKVASADAFGASAPLVDDEGHGTHVSGLACAATGEGSGIAGAGWDCRIAIVKAPNLEDQDIVSGIKAATDRGAQAINMSFGGGPTSTALDAAIDYALARNVVLVAAAGNEPVTDQGAPAAQLQPGDAPDINAGRGLVVTGVDFADQQAGTGRGRQISLAAYGFFDGSAPFSGPEGLLSTYPATTFLELPPLLVCSCRTEFNGDSRYAYLEGTSMAAPQVTAVAALIGAMNPSLTAQEKMTAIKQSARRSGGWNELTGWGILDAGGALDSARRIDHQAPETRAKAKRRVRRGKRLTLRLTGSDPAGRPGLVPSGIASIDVYMKRGKGRYRRIRAGITERRLKLKLRPGVYRFYSRATDTAGNVEAPPPGADARTRVRRR